VGSGRAFGRDVIRPVQGNPRLSFCGGAQPRYANGLAKSTQQHLRPPTARRVTGH